MTTGDVNSTLRADSIYSTIPVVNTPKLRDERAPPDSPRDEICNIVGNYQTFSLTLVFLLDEDSSEIQEEEEESEFALLCNEIQQEMNQFPQLLTLSGLPVNIYITEQLERLAEIRKAELREYQHTVEMLERKAAQLERKVQLATIGMKNQSFRFPLMKRSPRSYAFFFFFNYKDQSIYSCSYSKKHRHSFPTPVLQAWNTPSSNDTTTPAAPVSPAASVAASSAAASAAAAAAGVSPGPSRGSKVTYSQTKCCVKNLIVVPLDSKRVRVQHAGTRRIISKECKKFDLFNRDLYAHHTGSVFIRPSRSSQATHSSFVIVVNTNRRQRNSLFHQKRSRLPLFLSRALIWTRMLLRPPSCHLSTCKTSIRWIDWLMPSQMNHCRRPGTQEEGAQSSFSLFLCFAFNTHPTSLFISFFVL